jgi:hypothetical protein
MTLGWRGSPDLNEHGSASGGWGLDTPDPHRSATEEHEQEADSSPDEDENMNWDQAQVRCYSIPPHSWVGRSDEEQT